MSNLAVKPSAAAAPLQQSAPPPKKEETKQNIQIDPSLKDGDKLQIEVRGGIVHVVPFEEKQESAGFLLRTGGVVAGTTAATLGTGGGLLALASAGKYATSHGAAVAGQMALLGGVIGGIGGVTGGITAAVTDSKTAGQGAKNGAIAGAVTGLALGLTSKGLSPLGIAAAAAVGAAGGAISGAVTSKVMY